MRLMKNCLIQKLHGFKGGEICGVIFCVLRGLENFKGICIFFFFLFVWNIFYHKSEEL